MATSIRIIDDFELSEKVESAELNLDDYKIGDTNSHKGLLKLTLSVIYFLLLVYFLFELLA